MSVVELVDTPDCGSGAAALRVQVSSLTPNGRVAEWFKAPSWKGGEGNTSASSNIVSSSIWGCRIAAIATVSKTVDESPPRFES